MSTFKRTNIVRGIQLGRPANDLPLLMGMQSQRKLFESYLKMILERPAECVIVIALQVLDARERGVGMNAELHKAAPQLVARMSTSAPTKRRTGAGASR